MPTFLKINRSHFDHDHDEYYSKAKSIELDAMLENFPRPKMLYNFSNWKKDCSENVSTLSNICDILLNIKKTKHSHWTQIKAAKVKTTDKILL